MQPGIFSRGAHFLDLLRLSAGRNLDARLVLVELKHELSSNMSHVLEVELTAVLHPALVMLSPCRCTWVYNHQSSRVTVRVHDHRHCCDGS